MSLTKFIEVAKKASNSFDKERVERPVPQAYPAIARPPSPCHPRSLIMIDGHREGSLTEEQAHYVTGREYAEGRRTYHIFCNDLRRLLTGATQHG